MTDWIQNYSPDKSIGSTVLYLFLNQYFYRLNLKTLDTCTAFIKKINNLSLEV